MVFPVPRLYPILDAEVLARAGISLAAASASLYRAGVRWVQYRDKQGSDAQVLESLRLLRAQFPPGDATLIVNDRVHLCVAALADGVHIGQDDLPPAEARRMLQPGMLLGISTHNAEQLCAAVATGVPDYVAMGPVFATGTKENPDPVVGLDGVAAARRLTRLPLVAIGGITVERGPEVMEAGADAVAMISALLPRAGQTMEQRVRDILVHFR